MTATLDLPGKLDLGATAALQADLLARRGDALVLNGAQVSHIGAAMAQLLISALRTWREDGVPFSVTDLSDNALMCLAELGLGPQDIGASEDAAA